MSTRMIRLMALFGIFIFIVVMDLMLTPPAGAENVEQFYRGKTIHWVVASGPGSSTDLVARMLAPFLERETGARIKIENMGSDEGINYVYTRTKPDGLSLLMKDKNSLQFSEILKTPGKLWELEKFNYLADVLPEKNLFGVSPKSPYKTLEELRGAKGLKGGGTSAKGNLVTSVAVMMEILGLKGKVISGFKGRSALTLAVARGEIDITAGVRETSAFEDQKNGNTSWLFVLDEKRSILLPEIPTLAEAGIKIPENLEDGYAMVSGTGICAATTPGVPQEKIDYLRKIFTKMSENSEVQSRVRKTAEGFQGFIPGDKLQDTMRNLSKNKDLGNQLDAILSKYSAIK